MNHLRPHLFALLAALLPAATAHAQSAPAAPTGLAAAPLDAQAALTWNDPSDSTITGYSVRSSTSLPVSGSWTAIASSGATTTSHTVASLTNGTRYYFQIRATNANGNSATSNTATIQLAASPAVAVAISDANLRAKLEAATGKAAGVTITQLDMAKLQGRLDVAPISQVPPRRIVPEEIIESLAGLEYATNVSELLVSYNSISDFTPLASLTALSGLSLTGMAISDLTPFAGLTALEWLFINGNAIADLTPLTSLTALRNLNLGSNAIVDLTPLAGLTTLRWLYAGDNAIADLTPLAGLTALWWLNLDDNAIADLTPLASLTALTQLGLNGNAFADVMPLAGLTALNRLGLGRNPMLDLTSLTSLTSVRALYLHENAISDLTPLAGLTALRELYLGENAIEDLVPLAGLTALVALRLESNSISDLTPLAGLVALGWLRLSNNAVADLNPLAGLTALPRLELDGNAISDVTPLAGLSALTYLQLDRNQISDVAPLAANRGIGYNAQFGRADEVHLSGNPLSRASVYVHVPAMQNRGAVVYFDPLPSEPNVAPEVARALDDAALTVGGRLVLDISGVFRDPDGDPLTFSATSSRPAVAAARVDGDMLAVTAIAEGQARITARATDTFGTTASLSFLVTVGNPASIGNGNDAGGVEAAVASVPEGGVAEVVVAMAAARTVDVSFAYSFGPDDDPATADADAADYGGEGGTVTIPAGETEATISIPILDDDDIEPAREAFAVTLTPTDGVGVAVSSAVVHIAEGVCDRTWQVADALRGGRACEAVTPAELARRRTMRLRDAGLAQLQPLDFLGLAGMTVLILDDNGLSALPEGLLTGSPQLRVLRLRGNRFETLPTLGSAPALIDLDLTGNLLTELPAQPFANLPALGYLYLGENQIAALPADMLAATETMRILELQDNALTALPEGLFAGVPKLVSLQLQGNPGAPFPLAVELARVQAEGEEGEDGTDGDAGADEPGRAEIQLRVPHGAPFAIDVEISAPGATLSAQTAAIAAGETLGGPVSVVRNVAGNEADAAVTVEITSVRNLPTATCGDDFDEYRCFRGFELTSGSPLTLFEPPAAADVPTMR